MPDPKLRLGVADLDVNMPLIDGTVKAEGFELEITHGTDDGAIHALLRNGALDASEYGFAALLRGEVEGERFVGIPAFPNRKFRLSYIYVNEAAGIESPRDLEGKRVGILAWSNTASVWARGALQHYYEVDLTRIRWFEVRPGGTSLPPGITAEPLREGADLDALLVSGELDAVIEPNVLPSIQRRDPRVRRLFRDYRAEEETYFKQTGIFPISHIVTLTQPFVERHPQAPVALLEAFRRARDEAIHRILDAQVLLLPWSTAHLDEQRALMGERYWAYNVGDNRRPLEAFSQFAHEQGLTPYRVAVDSLFAPEAAALPGF